MKTSVLNLTNFKVVVRVLFVLLLPFASLAQAPGNDLCGNATLLTSSTTCSTTSGDLASATFTSISALGCGAGPSGNKTYPDVWYSFQAKTSNPTITLSSSAQVDIQLFSGSCTSLVSMGCDDATIAASGLNIGDTYFVRVYTTNKADVFTICITDPPDNDLCAKAIDLTSSTTCNNTSGTLNAASTYTTVTGACNSNSDVWYKFVAKTTNPTITVGGALVTPRAQIYAGTCGGFTAVGSCPTAASTPTSGLKVGDTYYVRVYSNTAGANGTFDICVQDPPPTNDDCGGAISLTSTTTCTPTTGNMYVATSSTAPTPCGGSVVYDVWYSFIAQSTNPTITLGSLGTDITSPGLQLFSGTCTGLTSRFCGTNSIASSGLTIGSTYYVRVYASAGTAPTSATNAGFNICVTDPPPAPPSNDECAGATGLNIGTSGSGTVWGATNSNISNVCSGTSDDDVWFKFTPTATSATIALSSIGGNLSTSGTVIQVFSGSCGSLTSIACGTTSVTVLGLTANAEYYVRVYSAASGSIGGNSAGSAFTITVTGPSTPAQSTVWAGRMNEVFKQTTLSGSGILNDPWEVTYGPDGMLWITEAKGYKVYRMDPNTGAKTTILDISSGASGYLTAAEHAAFNKEDWSGDSPTPKGPQGGCAGLAIHPDFNTGKKYVYLSYVHLHTGLITTPTNGGEIYVNSVVRFTYNSNTSKLESPIAIDDTLPGSSDHNSQRMIIAPVNGKNYLFYASGDMGAGQFENSNRPNNAQIVGSYEGKILRFNLEPDASEGTYDQWIPNDNPFNTTSPAKQSAVWATGIRNNQGFAYDTTNDILYGSSHGPFSDDEINIIEKARNYGHPLVIGKAADGNYNGSSAGEKTGILPVITSESTNATNIGASYKDPIYTFYPATQSTVSGIWNNQVNNGSWPSEAPSGMDLYTNSVIPGWKKSLVVAALKWGRIMRIRLDATGTAIVPTNGKDTVGYFDSDNRFRDLAFAPSGKDIFIIMDKSPATSGPSTNNPSIITCAGCVQKYTFLGYNVNSGNLNKSYIPNSIDIASGTANAFETANKVVINAANGNTNLWVPITDANSNIVAEIYAQGRDLDTVTTTIYTKTGTSRVTNGKKYLNRHLTISPQKQPGGSVLIRLYISKTEYDQLVTDGGVAGIGSLKITKNGDSATMAIASPTTLVNTTVAESFSNGYVLQGDISGFSSFYFAPDVIVPLPLQLLTFKGSLQNNATLLEWETANEVNTSHFVVERSIDGSNFSAIGTVAAAGRSTANLKYSYWDAKAMQQSTNKLYYRLKQVDEDGSFSYSKTIVIELNHVYTVSIHPNPITDVLNIRLSLLKAQKVHIQVTDMSGRTIYSSSKSVNGGNNELQINTKSWLAQMYSIKITGSDNKPIAIQSVIKL